jgi:hypothetical protein
VPPPVKPDRPGEGHSVWQARKAAERRSITTVTKGAGLPANPRAGDVPVLGSRREKEGASMGMFFISFLTTLVSLAAGVVIVMLIVKSVNHKQNVRHEMFKEALERGVYDPRLISKKSHGNATLGWGIFFVAIGIAQLIGYMILGIFSEAAIGGLVPLFVGGGLILFHRLVLGKKDDTDKNGEPIRLTPDSKPLI